jgi:hypothetical protein
MTDLPNTTPESPRDSSKGMKGACLFSGMGGAVSGFARLSKNVPI